MEKFFQGPIFDLKLEGLQKQARYMQQAALLQASAGQAVDPERATDAVTFGLSMDAIEEGAAATPDEIKRRLIDAWVDSLLPNTTEITTGWEYQQREQERTYGKVKF